MDKCFKVITAVFIGLWAGIASATSEVELGLHVSNIVYTEPSVMQEKGFLSGLDGRLISQKGNGFKAIEVAILSGDMDYDGSGTLKDIPNDLFEVRGLTGNQWMLDSAWQVTSYIGLGYRYLNDDASGMITSDSSASYKREQVYYYTPIGIRFEHDKFLNNWGLYGNIEFDYFLLGKNKSYTGKLSAGKDLSFEQYNGFGSRFRLGFTRPLDNGRTFKVEAFYKYWNIEESTIDYDINGNAMVEPKNHSKEIGISVILAM